MKFVTITEVHEIRQSTDPHTHGDVRPVTTSCGHTSEKNWIYTYRVGDGTSCYECK